MELATERQGNASVTPCGMPGLRAPFVVVPRIAPTGLVLMGSASAARGFQAQHVQTTFV